MASKKSKKKNKNKCIFFLNFLNWEKIDMVLGKKKWPFLIGNGAEIRPLEKGRKSPGTRTLTVTGRA